MIDQLQKLKDWTFTVDFEGIAWAVFDTEDATANTLGRRALEELAMIVEAVEADASEKKIKGLVFMSGKPTGFILGADIKMFDTLTTEAEVENAIRAGNALFNHIESLKIPTVAAIHGFCLGGGLEMALACDWRIATRDDATRLGFPEVKLGIFPGLNGTVRSIRQAGAMAAMPLMLAGRMLRAGPARGMGLIDQLVPSHHTLKWAARKAVLRKRKSRGAVWWKKAAVLPLLRGILAEQMRKKTAEKVRKAHYAAPFALIDLFENFGGNQKRMAVAETKAFAPLMVSETSKNLRRVFYLSEALKNQGGRDLPKPKRLHVIGAGVMGGDIAAWGVVSGMEVSLQDLDLERIQPALKRAKKLFWKRLKKKTAVDNAMARLIPDVEGAHIPRADVVIEAIVERLDIKQKLFAGIEPRMKPGAMLATNTSSLPIEEIAEPLADPGRLVGVHFFNPVAKMPLVEVVRGPETRQEEVDKGCAFTTAINKFPVVVKSKPGFLVNRVLAPYMVGAIRKAEEGLKKEVIDAAAEKFGMPVGPIELADQVGLDVAMHVSKILDLGSVEGTTFARLVDAGKFGKKTGEGFYKWEKGKAQKNGGEFTDRDLDRIGKDLMQPLLDECKKCADEKIVETEDFIDAGVIFGTGFAPFRGGPMHYLKTLESNGQSTGGTEG